MRGVQIHFVCMYVCIFMLYLCMYVYDRYVDMHVKKFRSNYCVVGNIYWYAWIT